jgi:glycosyltransferase involved in cell wall biosynthesis
LPCFANLGPAISEDARYRKGPTHCRPYAIYEINSYIGRTLAKVNRRNPIDELSTRCHKSVTKKIRAGADRHQRLLPTGAQRKSLLGTIRWLCLIPGVSVIVLRSDQPRSWSQSYLLKSHGFCEFIRPAEAELSQMDAINQLVATEAALLTEEVSPAVSLRAAKILGFCEILEWGDGFLHIQGWIAWADKSPITGSVDIRIDDLLSFRVEALTYRDDLELCGITGGCGVYSAVISAQTPLPDPPNVYASIEGGPEERLGLLKNAVRRYTPQGAFYRVSSQYVSGWVFDCGNWITGAPASLVLDGNFVIPLDLAVEDNSRSVTMVGDFPYATGGYTNQRFALGLDEILRRVWEQDFDAPIADGELHDLALVSSGYEVARERICFDPTRRHDVGPANPPVEAAVPNPPTGRERAIAATEFDADFYLEHSPDLRGSKIDLLDHYLRHGWREHRDPSPTFSTAHYLRVNTDVREGGINPFVHFIEFGRREGRTGLPFRERMAHADFQPLVTIVVPNYNHARFLPQRIESILAQTYRNFEILLLDDCSTDSSIDVIERYAREYPELIRVFLNPANSGKVFAQWKKGIENASGDFIWICESDDFCEPDFLAKCLQPFVDDSVMVSFGRVQFSDKEGHLSAGLDAYREQAEPHIWGRSFSRPACEWFQGSFAVSNLIPNVGGCVFRAQELSDEVWSELLSYHIVGDWYLYAQLARGGQIAFVADAVAYFRQHEQNTSGIGARRENYYIEHERLITKLRELWGTPDDVAVRCYQNVYRQFVHASAKRHIGSLTRIYSNDRVMRAERTSKHLLMAFLGFQLGGGELFPIYLANQLVAQGYLVSMLMLDVENENNDVRRKLDHRIPVYTCEYVAELGVNEFLTKAGVDIIHSHNAGIEYFFFNSHRFDYPIPYVVTLHGSYEVTSFSDELMARIVKGVSHWVYLTERNIAHLQNIPPLQRKISFIANGMPRDSREFLTSRADLGIGETDIVFALASRAIRDKGWREAVEAILSAGPSSKHPLHLLLCGSGPEAEALALKYAAEKQIHILGFQDRINGIYRMSDVVILPTRFGGESFPLTLIQALQVGRPIIATDVGEIRRMLVQRNRSAGILLPMLDDDQLFTASLADAMLKTTNPKTRSRFARDAAIIGEEYDMYRVGARYEAIYHKAWAVVEHQQLDGAT